MYTGITTDPKRREKEHNNNDMLGAKSLKGKRPVNLVYVEPFNLQNDARKREVEIKGWKRKYKLKLVAESNDFTRKYFGERTYV